jgi:hypothetical protein
MQVRRTHLGVEVAVLGALGVRDDASHARAFRGTEAHQGVLYHHALLGGHTDFLSSKFCRIVLYMYL